MAIVGELVVLLAANNAALTAGLAKGEAELKGFSSTGTSSLGAVGIAGAALAAATAVIGVEAIKSASHFQSSMELIRTQAGASQAEVVNMTKAVLALGPAVGTSPQMLADALFHIESAGLRGSAALKVLTAAAQGAKVGNADLETVTNALVAAQFSHIKGTTDMTATMGTLNAIVGAGNMRMQDLAASMSSGILPAARTFGLSITDVGAALATMTDQGVPAEEAATRLRMTFALLGAPTAKAVKDLALVGITHRELAEDMRKPNGLMVALTDLSQHLKNSGLDAVAQGEVISGAFGGGRTSGTIEALLNRLDLLGTKYVAIGAGANKFGADWEATTKLAKFATDTFGTSIEVVTDSIGLGLLPLVTQILGVVNPLVSQFAAWASHNQQTAATVLLIAGAVGALLASTLVLGPVLGAIATVVGIITSPIILLAAGIAALVIHFNLLAPIAKTVGDVINNIASLFENAGKGTSPMDAHLRSIQMALNPLTGAFRVLESVVSPVMKAVGDAIGNVSELFADAGKGTSPLDARLRAAREALNPLTDAFRVVQSAVESLEGAFATLGGLVSGQISGGQILAELQALGGQVLSWIGDQAPIWEAQLGTWAGAFVDWIAPMIPPALSALGDLASQVLAWIAAQVPSWVSAVQAWVAGFTAWAGPIIDRAIGALGDFGAALLGWISREIPVVAAAAIPIGGGIVNAIGGALGGLAGKFGEKLTSFVKDFDPVKFAQNLGGVLQGATVIAAVVLAGQVVGAAFAAANAAAAAVVSKITGLLSAALAAEQGAMAKAVGVVAGIVGAAFSLAFRVAATAISALAGLFATVLTPIGVQMGITAATVGSGIGGALGAGIAAGITLAGPLIIAAIAGAIFAAIPSGANIPHDPATRPVGGRAPNWNPGAVPQLPTYEHLSSRATGDWNVAANQWAFLHAGEMVVPSAAAAGIRSGTAGGTTHLTLTTNVQIERQTIMQLVEEHLFSTGSAYSSGFAGSPVTE